MWGLLERTVAVECLATVAGELKKSKADLQGLLPASKYSSLETFFSRTVEAAGHTYRAKTKHLHNVETPFVCPQAFLSLDFQCRDGVFELKLTFQD